MECVLFSEEPDLISGKSTSSAELFSVGPSGLVTHILQRTKQHRKIVCILELVCLHLVETQHSDMFELND